MRSFWRAGRGGEAILDGQQELGAPPKGSAGVGRPSWRAGRGREAIPDGWGGQEAFPEGRGSR